MYGEADEWMARKMDGTTDGGWMMGGGWIGTTVDGQSIQTYYSEDGHTQWHSIVHDEDPGRLGWSSPTTPIHITLPYPDCPIQTN